MKIEVYASNVAPGDVVWLVPSGKTTAVKVTVIATGRQGDQVVIVGQRMFRGEPVKVDAMLLAFAPVKMEMS